MITPFVQRVAPIICLLLFVAGLARKQSIPALGSDGYFHLRMGQEFLAGNWSIRSPGHFGAFDTAEWQPTQWAPQVAMAWVHEQWGMAGFVTLAGLLILLVPLTLYLGSRSIGASPLPAAVSMALALLTMSSGMTARPQVISYVLVTVFTVAWLKTATDHKPRYWLILLNWLWVPMHGMWFVGVAIGAVAVLGIFLQESRDVRLLGGLAAIPLGSIVAAAATPLGWGVYGTIGAVGTRARILTEWKPTDFTQAPSGVLVLMIVIILCVGIRHRSFTWPQVTLLVLAAVWALYAQRTVHLAAAMTAPMLAVALEQATGARIAFSRREAAVVALVTSVGVAILAWVAVHRADRESEPAWVNERLAAMPAGTKVLNDWELGHNLLYRQPHVDLVIHGYLDVFTPDEIERNTDIVGLEPGWDDEVAKLDVDYALVRRDAPLGYALEKEGWAEVESDKTYVLLTPPD